MNQGINLPAVCIADGFGIFLSIIMLGANIWKNGDNKSEGKLIRLMLYTALFSCISDVLSLGFDGIQGMVAIFCTYIGNLWLYISNMLMGTLWVMLLISHISGKKLPKGQIILTLILDIIGALALIVNFFVPVVYSISEQNVYSRGPLFWLYMAIEFIFTFDGVITYFVVRKKNPEAKYFPVWQFIIPIITGIAVQSIMYGVTTIWPALTIAIAGIILGLFNESEAKAEILRQNEANAKLIIEQKKQIDEALAMAESANRAKTVFLFNMSHDIRTPLNAITGFTNMAVRHIDDKEKALDCLAKIQQSEGMLLSLIDSVLEVSRIESGNATLEEKAGDVYLSFVNFESAMRELASTKHIRLNFEFGEIRNRYVYADFSSCMRVFVNIISNAIKYTNEGGYVNVRCEQVGDVAAGYATYQYTISDNGIGMSEEFQKHLFEQFSRERNTTASGITGTGLGLAVVKSFVGLMGGTVYVKSKQGEGTTFTIILPFRLQDSEDYTDPVTGKVVTIGTIAEFEKTADFTG